MKKVIFYLFAFVFIIMLMGSSISALAAGTYTFGIKDSDDPAIEEPPKLTTQGVNNFYFYYAKEANKEANIDLSAIKPCVYGKDPNDCFSWYGYSQMTPQQEDTDYYRNVVWPSKYGADGYQMWFIINEKGDATPDGDMCSVIYFQAPEAGKYDVETEYFGGAKEPSGDGVTFAIYDKTIANRLLLKNTKTELIPDSSPVTVPKKTVSLQKDDKVYFVVDPNATFAQDKAHWFINITYKEALPSSKASSAISSESSSESVSEISSEPESIAATESPSEISSESSSASSSVADTANNTGSPWVAYLVAGIAVLLIGGIAAYYFIFVKAKKT